MEDESKTIWLILACIGLMTLRMEITNYRVTRLERVLGTGPVARTEYTAPKTIVLPAVASGGE